MTRLSEITEKLSKVEKGTNEMISKKDEKKKHMSYPLPDYAGMSVYKSTFPAIVCSSNFVSYIYLAMCCNLFIDF